MDNLSLTTSEEISNSTVDVNTADSGLLRMQIIASITCVVCIFGLLGNGTVIWLLGFRMKGNFFTTYILNLAVADFSVLLSSLILAISQIVENNADLPYWVSYDIFYFPYSISQFLLTAISIDRCVSVLFPIWYRCRRPKKLSAVVCAVIWILSFLQVIGLAIEKFFSYCFVCVILVNSAVCLTSITVATLILFVKFCFKSQQRKRGRLLMAILLTLFFFLILAFPINVIYLLALNFMFLEDWSYIPFYIIFGFGILCASLNSFVNPFLYFLVGRKKRGLCGENLKLILQRVFIEEQEANREEPGIQL